MDDSENMCPMECVNICTQACLRAKIKMYFNCIYYYYYYLQTTFNFHVVSKKSPVTFGFSARHVIDLPSSSVDGTKLNSERLVVLYVSSCKTEKRNRKKKIKMKNIYRKIKTIFFYVCFIPFGTCMETMIACVESSWGRTI